MSKKISKLELSGGIKKMNSFGSRLTGSEGQLKFIKYLQKEIENMGIDVYRDPFFFRKWEERESSLTLYGHNGPEDVEIASVFPYSGQTKENGISAELFFVEDKIGGYSGVKGKIAVIEISEVDSILSELAFDKRSSYPDEVALPEKCSGPLATTFVKFQYARLAKLKGAKAIVFIWKGIADECLQGQYLPFVLDYQGIPAVWVNSKNGKRIIEAARGRRTATLKLVAQTCANAYTESFYCILRGKNEKEAVIVNTHTDGTNCIEENGAIAMLQLIKVLKEKELERTHIFVFATGHFRLPDFRDVEGGGMQATSKWLAMHKDLWNGKKGHLKAVAGVTIEHLGCMEWVCEKGEYKPTGEIQTELVYAGNDEMNKVYLKCVKDRNTVRAVTLRGHNLLHFGEGQPFFNVGIPGIALVSAPEYLCAVSPTHEVEKFNAELMYEQTETFRKILERLDQMSSEEIGECDDYSIINAKNASGRGDINIKSIKERVISAIKK